MLIDLLNTVVAKIFSFEPVMSAIGLGALYAHFETSFLNDPKSWVLVISVFLLNLSKVYRNIKGNDK